MVRSGRARIPVNVAADLKTVEREPEPATASNRQPPPQATPSEILAELKRIRESRTLGPSKRLVQFLSFVVEATLRGEAHHLKETTIGVSLFGRPADYDPKADTVVRNQAWRLRSKLKEYYASEGADDRLVIQIPTGHYSPVFVLRSNVAPGHLSTSPQPHSHMPDR